jgi:hypothetical protein
VFFFSTGHGFGDQKTDRLCYPLPQLTRIGALSIVCARRRMCVLNKSLPDPGSNGIRGKYLISAVYFLCGLASDVLLKTPARAGVVLKSPYEPRNKSAKNSHPPNSRRPERRSPKRVNLDDDAGELCVFSRLATYESHAKTVHPPWPSQIASS